MKRKILFFIALLLSLVSKAQQVNLTENVEISIITVASGNNLVDSFGHSAIRVKDNSLGLDYAYNYGTYDFNAPNFYGNFAKGKLLYILSVSYFNDFLSYYSKQNRSVKEQVLNLSFTEKKQFFNYLNNNAKPKNRGYYYDFFYDNCATKLRDVSENILKEKVVFNYDFAKDNDYTMRGLIHKYSKTQPWGTFGIDLALGSVIDKKATPEEYVFLPDYIFETYKNSKLKNGDELKSLINKTNILFESKPLKKSFNFSPLILFSALAIVIILITYNDYIKGKRSKWLDFSLFFITGLLGLFMLLLWFATNHTATANNYNILWAFAPNLIISFYLLKKELKSWLKKYSVLLIILLLATIILWLSKVQEFNLAIIPIMVALSVRYYFLRSYIVK